MSKLGVWSSSLKPPIWKSENAARLLGVPQRLGRGDLHRLVVGDDDAEVAAEPEVHRGDRHEDDQRQLGGVPEDLDVPAAQEVPAGDPETTTAAAVVSPTRITWMNAQTREPVREQLPDARQLGAAVHDRRSRPGAASTSWRP